MHKLIFLLSFTSLTSWLSGQITNMVLQGSEKSYFYQIDKWEAEKLYNCNLKCLDDHYFHTLVDSAAFRSYNRIPDLPYGHYLMVYLVKNELTILLETSFGHHVMCVNNKRDLQIRIQKHSGEILQNLDLNLNGKHIPFSPKDAAYVKLGAKDGSVLKIESDSIVAYFTVEDLPNYWYKRSKKLTFLQTSPVKYIYQPLRYMVVLPIDIYKSIKLGKPYGTYNRLHWRVRALAFRTKLAFKSKETVDSQYRNKKSFIVLDKAKYRKTDTLRIKTYLLNIKNKPINIPVDIYFDDGKKEHRVATLLPLKPGVYHHEFVLPDHFNIKHDKQYRITIQSRNRKILSEKWISFEDYTFKKHKLELLYVPKEIYQSRNLEFQYQFKDANDFTAINSNVNLTLKWNKTINYVGKSIFVPDYAFLDTSFIIKNPGIGFVNLELQNMPAIDGIFSLNVRFTSPDNEVYEENFQINYYHSLNSIEIIDNTDSLKFQYLEKGIVTENTGRIFGIRGHSTSFLLYEGKLPTSLPMHGIYTRYKLQCSGLTKEFSLKDINSGVYIKSSRAKNKLLLELINPRNLTINYQIFEGDKLLKRGFSWRFTESINNSQNKDYSTSIQFPWEGYYTNLNFRHLHQKDQLFIEVNEPQSVYPGQEVELTISVSDYRGKPISGADVTAYGMNSLFGHSQNWIGIGTSKHRIRRTWKDYQTSSISETHSKVDFKNDRWMHLFGLDSILYYKVINPGGELFRYLIPSKDSTSYFMPFIVDSTGRILQTYVIYVDYLPIYASWTDLKAPYAFKIDPGYHKIKLRTSNHEFNLDSVFIEQGNQHILSLNIDQIPQNIKFKKLENKWTSHEYEMLSKRMLLLGKTPQKSNIYIKDDLQYFNIPININQNLSRPFVIGPINGNLEMYDGKSLIYSFSNTVGRIMEFEGKYIYVYPNSYQNFMPSILEDNTQEFNIKHKPFMPTFPKEAKVYPYTVYPQKIRSLKIIADSVGMLKLDISKFNNTQTHKYDSWIYLKSLSIPGISYIQRMPYFDQAEIVSGLYELNVFNSNTFEITKDTFNVLPYGMNFYKISKDCIVDSLSSKIAKGEIDSIIDYRLSLRTGIIKPVRDSLVQIKEPSRIVSGSVKEIYKGTPAVKVNIESSDGLVGTTDESGEFSVIINIYDRVLTFSSPDYEPAHYVLNDTNHIEVSLENFYLHEIVITGYSDEFIRYNTQSSSIIYSTTQDYMETISFVDTNSEHLEPKNLHNEMYLEKAVESFTPVDQGEGKKLRSDFRDNAFWIPSLTSDLKGRASFKAKIPEDITKWSTHYIAVDGAKQSGVKNSSIRSIKPILGQLFVPKILIFGDSVMIHGQVKNYTQDSIIIQSTFRVADSIIQRNQHALQFHNSEYVPIYANADTINTSYEILTKNGYFDGEQRKIIVQQQGLMEVVGNTLFINQDTSILFSIDTAMGPLHLQIITSIRDLIKKTADNLIHYPHNSTEQLASKLFGLLIYKQYFNHLFDQKMEEKVHHILKEINNRFNGSGWAWYSGSQLRWVSSHVLSTLKYAQNLGYEVSIDMDAQIESSILKRDLSKNFDTYYTYSKILLEMGYTGRPKNIPIDLENIKPKNNFQKIQYAYIRHLVDPSYSMDTVIALGKKTNHGGLYFTESGSSFHGRYSIDYHSYYLTTEIYHLLKSLGPEYKPTLDSIKRFFIYEYQRSNWLNTYYKTRIIKILLDDFEQNITSTVEPTIVLNGEKLDPAKTAVIQHAQTENTLIVTNSTFNFIYYFQKYQNQNPKNKEDFFKIEQHFTSVAKIGQDFKYKVKLSTLEDAGYIVVHIPIPGAFVYKEKKQIRGVTHTEYNADGVTLYVENFKTGAIEVELDLIPQFQGVFTLNPVQANSMYFPQISAHSTLNKITINQE